MMVYNDVYMYMYYSVFCKGQSDFIVLWPSLVSQQQTNKTKNLPVILLLLLILMKEQIFQRDLFLTYISDGSK